MLGFRFFWTLSMAMCLCVLDWGQTRAADAAEADMRLVAAAPGSPGKAKKGHSQSKAKPKAVPLDSQSKPRVVPLDSKAAAYSWIKHKRHGLLPPPSKELPQSGIASWVGKYFQGRPVAHQGEVHEMESFTAAHRAIAFNTILKVTDLNNGRTVLVRINDRGPYVKGRVIDLARAAAEYLGYAGKGLTKVRLELAGNDKDPAQRYYIRMRPSKSPGKASLVQGFGPFDKFDEAAALFISLYKSYPDAELMAVQEKS